MHGRTRYGRTYSRLPVDISRWAGLRLLILSRLIFNSEQARTYIFEASLTDRRHAGPMKRASSDILRLKAQLKKKQGAADKEKKKTTSVE
jgi:hypothetical protein